MREPNSFYYMVQIIFVHEYFNTTLLNNHKRVPRLTHFFHGIHFSSEPVKHGSFYAVAPYLFFKYPLRDE